MDLVDSHEQSGFRRISVLQDFVDDHLPLGGLAVAHERRAKQIVERAIFRVGDLNRREQVDHFFVPPQP